MRGGPGTFCSEASARDSMTCYDGFGDVDGKLRKRASGDEAGVSIVFGRDVSELLPG